MRRPSSLTFVTKVEQTPIKAKMVERLEESNRWVWCIVLSLTLFVSSFLVGFSWRILDYDMYGLKVNEISRAVVEREAYDSGRHFVGLGNVFERFKKSQREIVFLVDDPEREKGDDNGDDPGGAAGDTKGPITIRTKDGQRLDIELTFQFIVDKEKLYELYTTYGTEYVSIIVAVARARVRDIGSLYGSSDYFERRIDIEAHLKRVLDEELNKRFIKMVDLQLRSIIIPQELDRELKKIQLNQIQYTLVKAQLETDVILRETYGRLTKERALRDKKLTEENQIITNSIRTLEKRLVEIQEDTKTVVAFERAKMDAANKKYEMDSKSKIEKIKGRAMIAEEQTKYQVANITARIDLLQAKSKYNVTKISQDANLLKSKNVSDAVSQKVILESAAYKEAIAGFQTDAGFSADNIVSYEFSDLVGSIDPSKLKMDMQKPEDLYLPGQKASQEKNLKDKYGALV